MKRSSYLSYIYQLYIFKGENFLLLRIMGNGGEIIMRHYVKAKWTGETNNHDINKYRAFIMC